MILSDFPPTRDVLGLALGVGSMSLHDPASRRARGRRARALPSVAHRARVGGTATADGAPRQARQATAFSAGPGGGGIVASASKARREHGRAVHFIRIYLLRPRRLGQAGQHVRHLNTIRATAPRPGHAVAACGQPPCARATHPAPHRRLPARQRGLRGPRPCHAHWPGFIRIGPSRGPLRSTPDMLTPGLAVGLRTDGTACPVCDCLGMAWAHPRAPSPLTPYRDSSDPRQAKHTFS